MSSSQPGRTALNNVVSLPISAFQYRQLVVPMEEMAREEVPVPREPEVTMTEAAFRNRIASERAAAAAGIKVGFFPFEEIGEMEAALVGGRCDTETYDVSKLAEGRSAFHGRKNDFEILPDRLTIDPLSPVVRDGDADWARVVDWVTGALVQAEISGVTQDNAEAMKGSADMIVQSLVGVRQGMQWGLFLDRNWSLWAIEAVGNYGEMFDRDVGAHSPMRLERGVNRPWTEGGMLWSPPIR